MLNSNVSDYELIVPTRDKTHKISPSVKHLYPVVQLSAQYLQAVLIELHAIQQDRKTILPFSTLVSHLLKGIPAWNFTGTILFSSVKKH